MNIDIFSVIYIFNLGIHHRISNTRWTPCIVISVKTAMQPWGRNLCALLTLLVIAFISPGKFLNDIDVRYHPQLFSQL